MNDDEVYKMIKTVIELCPLASVSSFRVNRIIDQDSFLDAVKKILAERKPQ